MPCCPSANFRCSSGLSPGVNVNDIAQQLALGNKTVSTHKARLMQKLNITSLADLVKYAMEHKLL